VSSNPTETPYGTRPLAGCASAASSSRLSALTSRFRSLKRCHLYSTNDYRSRILPKTLQDPATQIDPDYNIRKQKSRLYLHDRVRH
jgi:hypothetical protein